MNLDLIILFIPVIWAIVSALIGLILYKSSKAFFTLNHSNRQIRLVGSVVIAALAFWGIKNATPKNRLESSFEKTINDSYILATEIERECLGLDACLKARNPEACDRQAEVIKSKATQLRNKLNLNTE